MGHRQVPTHRLQTDRLQTDRVKTDRIQTDGAVKERFKQDGVQTNRI